jgi:hypothetical protein
VSQVPLGTGPLALAERDARRPEPAAVEGDTGEAATESGSSTDPPSGEDADDSPEPGSDADAEAEPGAPEPGAAGVSFEGLYSGKDVARFRVSGLPEREQLDDRAQVRIETESDTRVRIALVNSENGDDICELGADVTGNVAEIEPGQPCFVPEGQSDFQAEVTGGTAVLEGERLTLEARGQLSLSIADRDHSGELDYSFRGKRR